MRKIFLVDNDPVLVDSVKDYLEMQGYHVLTANNGLTAKVMLGSQKPDLIILDVDMPVMNGLELLEYLRAGPMASPIPIILLSGVPSAVVAPTLEGKILVSHIKKPVEPDDLLSLVRHYLPPPD